MTTTTARQQLRALLTITLAITTGATVAALGPPAETPAAAQPATGPMVPLNLPAKPTIAGPKTVQPAVSDTCSNPKPAATHNHKLVVCLTTPPGTASATARTAAGTVTPNATVGSNCRLIKALWEIDRTTACIQSMGLTAEVRDPDTKDVIASQHFLVNQNIILNTNSPGFVENDTVTRDALSSDTIFTRMEVNFFARCDAPCQTNNPATTLFLPARGSSQNFSISYFGSPASGGSDMFNTHYSFAVVLLDEVLVSDTFTWNSPESIRCDDKLRPRLPGCVFSFWGPLLTLPVSVYGAAAINVAVGQSRLILPFGTQNSPLTRGDTSISDPNRNAVCDGSFFPSLLLVQNDSCDEYPFASTQQSAAQRGFTGVSCLEIMPLQKTGEWVIWLLNGDSANLNVHPCVRGHVNKDQNVAVGTAVSTMYTNYRMLTGDAYAVEVTL